MVRNPEETPYRTSPEGVGFSELHEQFRKSLEEKLADSIKDRVTKRIQEYLEDQVGQSRLDETADRIFNSFLRGASSEDMDAELKKAAKEVAGAQL